MKIRTQILLVFLPVFMVLGGLLGGIIYFLEGKQLEWARHQELQAYGISLAELLGDEFEDAQKQKLTADAEEALQTVLNWRRLHVIAITDLAGAHVKWQAGKELLPGGLGNLSAEILESTRQNGSYVSDVLTSEDGEVAVHRVYSILTDPQGAEIGVLVVEANALWVTKKWQETEDTVWWVVVGTFVVGILFALLVSAGIRSGFRQLERTADGVLEGRENSVGHVEHAQGDSIIREISDLSHTFQTMGAVLLEQGERVKKSIVEAEQFRTEEDLAELLQQETYGNKSVQTRWIEAAAGIYGGGEGYVMELLEHAGGVYGILARMSEGGKLQRLSEGGAMLEYWKVRMREVGVVAATEEVVSLFKPQELQILTVSEGMDSYRKGTLNSQGDILWENQKIESSDWIGIYHFTHEVDSLVESVMSSFQKISLLDVMKDFEKVFPVEASGVLILYRTNQID